MAVSAPEIQDAQLLADAAGLTELSPEDEKMMSHAAVIGGLGSSSVQRHVYQHLAPRKSFIPIPDRGLGTFDEMYGGIEAEILREYEEAEERLVLICHSLGSVFGMRAGLEHADIIKAVISLAGLPSGIRGEKAGAKALKYSLGNPDTAENLQTESDFMRAHTADIAEGWSPDTSVHLVAPVTDLLIPPRQQLDLTLPDGQQPEKRMVVPKGIKGISEWTMRRFFGMPPDAQALHSWIWADHVSLAWTPAVTQRVRDIRRGIIDPRDSATAPLPGTVPEAAMLAA